MKDRVSCTGYQGALVLTMLHFSKGLFHCLILVSLFACFNHISEEHVLRKLTM